MRFLIGLLIVCYVLAVPALRDVAFMPLGRVALAIGPIWLPRALGTMAVPAALLLAPAFPASAQTDQQVDWCNGEDNATPELSISGCTAMIQSSEHITPDELAIVFNNRGVAYFRNGQSERAIQDYDQAIRLRPNFFSALISRGFTYLNMQNYGAAIADFDTALKVHPESAPSLYGRGLANRAKGDAAGASADIVAAQRLDSTIAQKLAVWGVNLESPSGFASLPPAADPTIAPKVEQSATPPAEQTTSLPLAAASVPTSAPQVERRATHPPAEDTASSPPAAVPVPTNTPPVEQSATPPSMKKTASLPPAAVPVPTNTPPVEQTATPPALAEETASLPLPAEVTEALIERGDELLRTGDIVAARFAYVRAAAGGNRVAATGVAKTYDPVFLAQSGVRGLRGDPAQAALWYGKAAAAGGREAQERLKRLRSQFPQ
jgi:hypothetical protein